MSFLPRTQYELLQKIDECKVSSLYQAYDYLHNQELLIKIFPPGSHISWKCLTKFPFLLHPNILPITDTGYLFKNKFFTASPKIEGLPLSSSLSQAKEDFISIAFQLANALSFLHQQEIIHRDISLNNIILTPEGRIYLADLDFCWSISSRQSKRIVVGTFPYLKPEIIQRKEYYTYQSDLYALGIVLLESYLGEKFVQKTPDFRINQEIDLVEETGIQRLIEKLLGMERKKYEKGKDFLLDLLIYIQKNKISLEKIPLEYLIGFTFLEERREEKILKGILAQVEDSHSRIAVLIGEKECGKTSLLNNFWLRNKSSSSLGVFLKGEKFFSFLNSLSQQLKFLISEENLFSINDFFRLRENQNLDSLTFSQSAKFSFFEEMLSCLKQIIAKTKCSSFIFIVDDIDQSDSLLKECLDYLTKNSQKLPILYIFSVSNQNSFLSSDFSEIRIKQLSLEQYERTVYFPFSTKKGFFKYLYLKSSGHPFYFVEILREFLKTKEKCLDFLLSEEQSYDFSFVKSPVIRDLYQKKVSRLNPIEKELLEFCSFFPDKFEIDQISYQKPYPNIQKSLSRLVEFGFIKRVDEDKYCFLQPWKDLIYSQISKEKRKEIHANLAHQAVKEGLSKSTIAFHFLHSQDCSKGIKFALEAAIEGKEKLIHEDGLNILEQYLTVVDSIQDNCLKSKYFFLKGELNLLAGNFYKSQEDLEKALQFSIPGEIEQGEIRLNLARALYGSQKYELALKVLMENKNYLDELTFSSEIESLRIKNNYLLAKNLWLTGQTQKAINELQNSYHQALNFDELLAAKGRLDLGYFLIMRGEKEEAEKHLNECLKIFEQYEKIDETGFCQLYLAYLEREKRHWKESLILLEKAHKSFSMARDLFSLAKVSSDLGRHYLTMENWEEAKNWFEKSEELFSQINNPRGITLAKFNLGEVALHEGEWHQAEEIFRESLNLDRKSGNQWSVAYDLNSLGYLYYLKGQFNSAEECLKEGVKIFQSLEGFQEEADCWSKLAELYIEKKEYQIARDCISQGSKIVQNINSAELKLKFGFLSGMLAFYQNDLIAEKIVSDILTEAQEMGIKSLVGRAWLLKGKVLKDKHPREAKAAFLEGIRIFKKLKDPYWQAEAFIDYYQVFPDLLSQSSARANLLWAKDTLKKLASFKANSAEELISHYLPQEAITYQIKEEATEWVGRSLPALQQLQPPSGILNQLLDLILQEIPAERAAAFLLDDQGEIVYRKSRNKNIDEQDISISLIKRSFREKRALILNNLKTDPQFKDNESVIIHDLDSVVCLPLTIEGKTAGVIYLDRKIGFRPFSHRDVEFLIAISTPISLVLKNSLEFQTLREKLDAKYKFPIIGQSRQMERVFSIMDRVKDLDVPVLISGESGTGKELIARAIHYQGARKNKEFVAVNCSALPENLLEAELFGYIKGAFTGANRDRKGLIEEAEGGTFFLDEIGDLSLSLQSKLLRVLQEKEIRRIGENKTRKINVRFISATNKNLDREIEKGNFREDLYYRIKVIPIEVPPLRKRREDIPLLADHFLKKYSQQMGKERVYFSPEAIEMLINYSWPGNIRELENEIQRILVFLGEETLIKKEHLSFKIIPEEEREITFDSYPNLSQAREQFEKNFVLQALVRNNYNQSKTARNIGLSRQGLLKAMKKYNIALKRDLMKNEQEE
ncbi:MAG: sigma 54-interacting transcriptional regulator [Candidatus Aminicenantia bacterium]